MKGFNHEENAISVKPRIDIIVAVDNAGGIGLRGDIPWRLEKEWQHFLRLVTRTENRGFVCWIMGRKSWEQHKQSGGLFDQMDKQGHRVLKIVLSRTYTGILDQYSRGASNWDEVIECADALSGEFEIESFWNLGGPEVYVSQLESTHLDNSRLFLTRIDRSYECDKFFPDLARFGLHINSENRCLQQKQSTFRLAGEEDKDVDDTTEVKENEVTWTYHVYRFTNESI